MFMFNIQSGKSEIMSRTFLILAFIVLAIATGAFALNCYSCLPTNIRCNDQLFSAESVSTTSDCNTCMKLKIAGFVTRSCGVGLGEPSGCITVKPANVTTTTCICSTDLCNGGRHVTGTMGTMLLSTAIMILKNVCNF